MLEGVWENPVTTELARNGLARPSCQPADRKLSSEYDVYREAPMRCCYLLGPESKSLVIYMESEGKIT